MRLSCDGIDNSLLADRKFLMHGLEDEMETCMDHVWKEDLTSPNQCQACPMCLSRTAWSCYERLLGAETTEALIFDQMRWDML